MDLFGGRGRLVGTIGGVFLLGFTEAVVVAIPLVALFLALNAVVVGVSLAEIVATPQLIGSWTEALTVHGTGFLDVAGPAIIVLVTYSQVILVRNIAGAVDALVLGQHPLAVLGMHQRLPEARLHGFLGCVAQQPPVLRAVVDDRAAGCVDLRVEHRGDLFGQRPITLRSPGQPPLALDPLDRRSTGGRSPRPLRPGVGPHVQHALLPNR
jgi:hypothetical protein